jgi:hypothetical protein
MAFRAGDQAVIVNSLIDNNGIVATLLRRTFNRVNPLNGFAYICNEPRWLIDRVIKMSCGDYLCEVSEAQLAKLR